MRIDHIAMWVKDLDKMKDFYCYFFQAKASTRYTNTGKQFSSYFLKFENGARIEIMHKPGIEVWSPSVRLGWAHLAISVGSREKVDTLTELLKSNNVTISGNPRITGDGYYESTVLDPEGNIIEITE